MEAIQEFIDKRKKRVYFGIKIYGAMVLAGALAMLLLAHGDVKRILDEMMSVVATVLATLFVFLISLIVIKMKMKLNLDGFTSEEKSRIMREAGKMPKMYDFLLTSDVLIFVQGYRVHAIPVKDIIWAYEFSGGHNHLYRSGNIFFTINRDYHYLVVVQKNWKKIQIPLSAGGTNWKAEVAYAYKVIERKRPKAYLGYLDEMARLSKIEMEAMVDFVEKGGTTDGRELEVQYGLNRWYQEEIPDYDVAQNENVYGVIRADIEGVLFVAMLFGIVLAGLFFYFTPVFDGDAVAKVLQTNMWRFFAPAAVLIALPLIMLIVYIKTVLCDSHRKKYGKLHAAYIILFVAWSLFLVAFVLLASKKVYGIASLKDYRLYQAGDTLTYEGSLVLTEEPVDVERGVKILTEDGVYYLQSTEAYYKIPKEMYDGSELMQENYIISYLPHTGLVVSLKDSEGNERLKISEAGTPEKGGTENQGAENSEAKTPDAESSGTGNPRAEWKYGDIVYAKNPGIYGYEDLTEDEKNVFDFLYSRLKTKNLEHRVAEHTNEEVEESTSPLAETFSLPVEISEASYKKVMALFEANQKFDFYDPVRYGIQKSEGGKITQMYVGMQIWGDPLEANGYHLAYEEMVQKAVGEIAEGIPDDASDREKIEAVKAYFTKKFKPFDDHKWFSKVPSDSEEEDKKIYEKMKIAKSGYGLLKTGSGKEKGYMEAFGAIARGLGLSVIPVMNEDDLQYWNKVCLDGTWYNIDLYQMAAEPSKAKQYDLVSDKKMRENGMENGTYGGDPSLALP